MPVFWFLASRGWVSDTGSAHAAPEAGVSRVARRTLTSAGRAHTPGTVCPTGSPDECAPCAPGLGEREPDPLCRRSRGRSAAHGPLPRLGFSRPLPAPGLEPDTKDTKRLAFLLIFHLKGTGKLEFEEENKYLFLNSTPTGGGFSRSDINSLPSKALDAFTEYLGHASTALNTVLPFYHFYSQKSHQLDFYDHHLIDEKIQKSEVQCGRR